mmetsp:Transcript_892/g.1185  ORF Transcript_892/g.1185 Transcript_892/m.1185 type:complete len:385 (-) Transcript_892:337-1491(-)|eukprot:CAMPEP_0198150962 /NCGR_PEP_ID=MMETSP1443-20131203/53424_1 /TAXON_ID=186043 /ORGANISM="Entomoneis sp., Strain CCMP2396" /LENGTH=384 /DNA_ID=CAMNT_0043816463 /DNA_START=35 /DNA_END=1189 /DNA_ORIENTATION=+
MSSRRRPVYGQVVVGPPGSGKTTYCNGMQQYMRLLGRNAWVVNLDPANERITQQQQEQKQQQQQAKNNNNGEYKQEEKGGNDDKENSVILPYETLFNVCEEVVNITSVMKETGLGPNGGLIYCMEYLEAHMDEILQGIETRVADDHNYNVYLIFDLPGQVELYTHSTCVQNLLQTLVKSMDLRLAAVQLIDAHYCTDASKYLSATLLGTTTMLRLELPTVNVLSKVDLLHSYGELDFALDFYTDCHDLDRLVPFVDQSHKISATVDDEEDAIDIANDPEYQRARRKRQSLGVERKFTKLHQALAEVVDGFGLLQFSPLDISDAASVGRVLAKVDKCNGYVFTQEAATLQSNLFQCAIQQDMEYDALAEVQERVLHKPKQKETGK